jgi:putative spermidine/putrescine transport system permease protein
VRRRFPLADVVCGAITVVLVLFVLAPVGVVLAGSFLNTRWLGISSEQWVTGGSEGLVTFKWFLYVLSLYKGMLLFSLQLALLSVAVCLLVAVPGGYALARSPFPGSRLLEEIVLVPLSMPGITLSIALIQAYTVARGRWELVLAGHLLYTVPFMVRATTSALRAGEIERLETAARSLGATFRQRFLWVVLPSLAHAIQTGALLVFAVSWGEFNVSYLLNTPLHQTYPAALYSTFTFNSFQVSSAATTIFLIVIVPALLLLQRLSGGAPLRVEQGA